MIKTIQIIGKSKVPPLQVQEIDHVIYFYVTIIEVFLYSINSQCACNQVVAFCVYTTSYVSEVPEPFPHMMSPFLNRHYTWPDDPTIVTNSTICHLSNLLQEKTRYIGDTPQ